MEVDKKESKDTHMESLFRKVLTIFDKLPEVTLKLSEIEKISLLISRGIKKINFNFLSDIITFSKRIATNTKTIETAMCSLIINNNIVDLLDPEAFSLWVNFVIKSFDFLKENQIFGEFLAKRICLLVIESTKRVPL